MILVDFSQVMISNLMVNLFMGKNPGAVQPEFLRHMILNALRGIRVKFKSAEWGEMVLCCDSKDYWRKDIFPHYKAARKKARSESSLDWEKIYQHLDQFKQEIKDNMPYRVVEVAKCEGDDIIATIAISLGNEGPLNIGEKIKIVSGDGDFLQLQVFGNVSQYDAVKKKELICSNPELERKLLILKGDSDDGVPNVLSPDNSFVDGIKQKPMTQGRIQELLQQYPDMQSEDVLRNVKRNESLVDLFKLPPEICTKIMSTYQAEAGKGRDKILSYLGSKKLKLLSLSVSEF